jgi:3-oxoacyl-[acyl-carrier protein] reductase
VNAVCPGFIQGEWLKDGLGEQTYNAAKAALEKNAPLRVTATADTVAEAILMFICGGSVITGETLLVDGGHHLMQVPMARR